MRYKKILVLENEHERYAKNDVEKDCIAKSFSDLPVKYWFGFNQSFGKHDEKAKRAAAMKKLMAIPDDTLCLTYTTFANGALSGYGDLFGGYVGLFNALTELKKKLNICVICSPELKWKCIDWISDGDKGKRQSDRFKSVVNAVTNHNIYSLDYSDSSISDFYKTSCLITPTFIKETFIPYGTTFTDGKGLPCRTGGFWLQEDIDKDMPAYHVYQQQRGKPEGYSIGITMLLEDINKFRKKVKHPR